MSNWISTKEKMPESGDIVLIIIHGKYVYFARHSKRYRTWYQINYDHCGNVIEIDENCVTHWQPLPEPPKE